jgi:hypothetical protein
MSERAVAAPPTADVVTPADSHSLYSLQGYAGNMAVQRLVQRQEVTRDLLRPDDFRA